MKHIVTTLLLGVLLSCGGNNEPKPYQPEGLRKLTEEEILDRLDKNQVFNPTKIQFKSVEGVVLSKDSIKKLFTTGETYGDQYVDSAGVVKEMILRPMTDEDKILIEKIDKIVKDRRSREHKHDHSGHNHDHHGHNH